jgi:hypothetical protein
LQARRAFAILLCKNNAALLAIWSRSFWRVLMPCKPISMHYEFQSSKGRGHEIEIRYFDKDGYF